MEGTFQRCHLIVMETAGARPARQRVTEGEPADGQVCEAFMNNAGRLWKAVWAPIISSAIQVGITREQRAVVLGDRDIWSQCGGHG